MVWLQLTELVSASVTYPVPLHDALPISLTPRLASTNVTVRLVSQVSLNTGVPKAGVAGHSMVASAGPLVTVAVKLFVSGIVWLQVTELVCASVAVQVRCVLLTSLPLTPRLASTIVTASVWTPVTENTGVPTSAGTGNWMVASAGQLVTVGALLSITVMV